MFVFFVVVFYPDGRKLKNRAGKQGTVLIFPRVEHHYFSYNFKYLSISPSYWLPSYCTSVVFLYIWKTDQVFFLTYHFLCPFKKKWKCLKIKVWCIQNKIRSSIFMFNSDAIWSELLPLTSDIDMTGLALTRTGSPYSQKLL